MAVTSAVDLLTRQIWRAVYPEKLRGLWLDKCIGARYSKEYILSKSFLEKQVCMLYIFT